jgi:hypothetical protein
MPRETADAAKYPYTALSMVPELVGGFQAGESLTADAVMLRTTDKTR